jgi:hypothetical protein
MKRSDFELLAREGADLLKKNPCMRSCWSCNPAHKHLKEIDYPFWCFDCGHVYYKGMRITAFYDKNELPKLINTVANEEGTDLEAFGGKQ